MKSPVNPEPFARLNASDAETARRKQEVLSGVMAALAAHKEGKDHPRLLTPARKAELKEIDRLRRIAIETSKMPPLPRIIVTRPVDEWRNYTTERRGRFGAVIQE